MTQAARARAALTLTNVTDRRDAALQRDRSSGRAATVTGCRETAIPTTTTAPCTAIRIFLRVMLWNWAHGRGFTDALEELTLRPRASKSSER
ncbi:MAG: hypothetical protein R3E12_14665 [Candidatus Eisenbacteria bacterium]